MANSNVNRLQRDDTDGAGGRSGVGVNGDVQAAIHADQQVGEVTEVQIACGDLVRHDGAVAVHRPVGADNELTRASVLNGGLQRAIHGGGQDVGQIAHESVICGHCRFHCDDFGEGRRNEAA